MPERVGFFGRFASASAKRAGHPWAFTVALSVILVWAVTGPIFDFNNTWQLAINTGTTIVTVLMVFLIQNAQNRDSAAIQIKLDELIRSTRGAHNVLLDLEELSEHELDALRGQYERIAEAARREMRQRRRHNGQVLTGAPKVVLKGEAKARPSTTSRERRSRPPAAPPRRSSASRRRSAPRSRDRSS
jgi:low affinity Fe/Cu permease